MAAPAPVPIRPQLAQVCDYCHLKPKFGTHLYCSKTCATQAAALCNHCHKKPKFQNFDYCGKNCAALASPSGKAQPKAAVGQATTMQPIDTAKQGPRTTATNGQQQQQKGGLSIDPVQLAMLVAQHIPQVQNLITPQAQPASVQPSLGVQQSGQVGGSTLPANHPSNNPFLDPTNQSSGPTNGAVPSVASSGAGSAAQHLHLSTQSPPVSAECLIPGCGQPVHVDAKGLKTSDYCSMRHREEAVTSGLKQPCILCLGLPQSDKDYFCSRVCREEAMNKTGVVDYDDVPETQ